MPFKSKRQLQTCFGKKLSAEAKGKKWSWNCEEWLRETPNPLCLPGMLGHSVKGCRQLKSNEKIISPVYTGARGGHYFLAKGIKVYVPKDAIEYAKRTMSKTKKI